MQIHIWLTTDHKFQHQSLIKNTNEEKESRHGMRAASKPETSEPQRFSVAFQWGALRNLGQIQEGGSYVPIKSTVIGKLSRS